MGSQQGAAGPEFVQSLWDSIGRCRPLTRQRRRLLYDALAVAGGARAVAMIDYACVKPAELRAALAPLSGAPGFGGGILVLDGCCYIAHMPHLQRRLALCVRNPDGYADGAEGTAGGGAAGAGASADGGETGAQEGMPFIVSFGGAVPALAGPVYFQELALRLRPLMAAVRDSLAPGGAPGASAGARAGAPGQWPIIDMGQIRGLPCMPTLNGWLLGYPVVYYVEGQEDATRASRMLSAARLRRLSVRLPCAAAPLVAAAPAAAGVGGAAGGWPDGELMAFTVPEKLLCPDLERAVARMMAALRAAVAHGVGGGGVVGRGGVVGALAGVWVDAPELVAASVGPTAVSL